MRQTIRAGLVVTIVGAVLGLWFSSMSTADFARHLDRQVHDVHCSFVPGLAGPERGESGCQVTLVSQYSSVWRTVVWGGIPVSLPAMAVFAFLLFFSAELWLTGRQENPRAAAFLVAATGLPLLASLVMAYLSLVELGTVCKLCIGVYIASGLCFGGAVSVFLHARGGAGGLLRRPAAAAPKPRGRSQHEPAWAAPATEASVQSPPEPQVAAPPSAPVPSGPEPTPTSREYLAGAFGVGVLFVLAPVLSYVVAAPDHSGFIGECGALPAGGDDYGIMVSARSNSKGAPAIEVLDPLCPACRGFEQALQSSGFDERLDRRTVLFPLDNACNWMVDAPVHPGACTVSYAVLCAKDRAADVLDWAFDHQEQIREATAADPRAAQRMVVQRFPELARCVKSQAVRARLNRSLRWAVANRLPVLTPQLYVGGAKLCDEDVDLGLEFALSRLLDAYEDGSLAAKVAEAARARGAEQPAFDRTRPPPGADAESGAGTETETETEFGTETEAGTETETETETESESESESGTEPEAEPGAESAAEPAGAAEDAADVDADFEREPEPEPETGPDVDADFEPNPESDSETGPDVDTDFEPNPEPDSETGPDVDADFEPNPEPAATGNPVNEEPAP